LGTVNCSLEVYLVIHQGHHGLSNRGPTSTLRLRSAPSTQKRVKIVLGDTTTTLSIFSAAFPSLGSLGDVSYKPYAMISSTLRPCRTIRFFSSAERCLRVERRISAMTLSPWPSRLRDLVRTGAQPRLANLGSAPSKLTNCDLNLAHGCN